MQLYKELFLKILKQEEWQIVFSEDPAVLIEKECYLTLQKIKEVLSNDELDDPSCFMKIEEIMDIFENSGISCGNRHDF